MQRISGKMGLVRAAEASSLQSIHGQAEKDNKLSHIKVLCNPCQFSNHDVPCMDLLKKTVCTAESAAGHAAG